MRFFRFFVSLFCWMSLSCFVSAQDLEPTEREVLLNITFTDFKDKALPGESIHLVGVKSKRRIETITDRNGKASLLLPKNEIYKIFFINLTEEVEYQEIEIDNEAGFFSLSLEMKYEPAKKMELHNVQFDSGKAVFTQASYFELDKLVSLLNNRETMRIEIAGHTDNVGKPEDNLELSQKRAEAVRDYLVSKGINPGRIEAKGYGETLPLTSNSTPEGRRLNRRTEVRVLEK